METVDAELVPLCLRVERGLEVGLGKRTGQGLVAVVSGRTERKAVGCDPRIACPNGRIIVRQYLWSGVILMLLVLW